LPAFLQEIVTPMAEAQQPRPPQLPAERRKQERRERKKKKEHAEQAPTPQARSAREMAGKSPFSRLARMPLLRQAIIYKEVFGRPGGRSFEDI
jgi:hypothetical protein